MILVKSIARFGRDTLETIRTLEKLRGLNVDVYFDLEELHSLNGANIHLITVLEATAQAENEERSDNIK